MTRYAIASVCGLVVGVVFAGAVPADPVPVVPAPRAVPAERTLAPGRAFAKRGQIDLFVAATAVWHLPADDDRLWEPALELAWLLAQKAEFTMWPPESCRKVFSSMGGYRERLNPTFIRRDEPYQRDAEPMGKPYALYQGGIMAPGVSSAKGGFVNNIIVSRGDVRASKSLCDSIVFVNGDITVGHHLTGSVVVCDGDVTVEGGGSGLVVARGSIRVKGPAWDCVLVAGGKVPNKVTKPRDFAVVFEQEPTPFGFVRFFELKTVGVDVAVADKEVRVNAVANGKPFAKAGVRVGDVVVSVNGKKPDSAESLRRLLRDALAVGDASVTLRRGDRTEIVTVSLPD